MYCERVQVHTLGVDSSQDFGHWEAAFEALVLIADSARRVLQNILKIEFAPAGQVSTYFRNENATKSAVGHALVADEAAVSTFVGFQTAMRLLRRRLLRREGLKVGRGPRGFLLWRCRPLTLR